MLAPGQSELRWSPNESSFDLVACHLTSGHGADLGLSQSRDRSDQHWWADVSLHGFYCGDPLVDDLGIISSLKFSWPDQWRVDLEFRREFGLRPRKC